MTSPATGLPDDTARACLGLVDATYATGQVLVADGGVTLHQRSGAGPDLTDAPAPALTGHGKR